MKVVIAGGSGFIGEKITDILLSKGYEVVILTRKEKRSERNIKYIKWLAAGARPEKEIQTADAFINLAGVSINDGRWTKKHQEQIYQSRMTATDELVRIIAAMPEKPSVLVNASAIGIYPSSVDTVYTEMSNVTADDFLGRTVHEWEKRAAKVSMLGVRTVYMRFGVVLGNDSGALPLMALPYKLFVGGKIGSGKQWVSWVHISDAARAVAFSLENDKLIGAVNITAPFPKQMDEFGKSIASILHRPHWFSVPAFVMKLVLGKKSSLVLEGQHAVPEVLKKAGFEFMFPELEPALEDLLGFKK